MCCYISFFVHSFCETFSIQQSLLIDEITISNKCLTRRYCISISRAGVFFHWNSDFEMLNFNWKEFIHCASLSLPVKSQCNISVAIQMEFSFILMKRFLCEHRRVHWPFIESIRRMWYNFRKSFTISWLKHKFIGQSNGLESTNCLQFQIYGFNLNSCSFIFCVFFWFSFKFYHKNQLKSFLFVYIDSLLHFVVSTKKNNVPSLTWILRKLSLETNIFSITVVTHISHQIFQKFFFSVHLQNEMVINSSAASWN